jgi:hypothetical protein
MPKGLPIFQNVTYCKLTVIDIGKESEQQGKSSKRLKIFLDTERKLEFFSQQKQGMSNLSNKP